VSVKKDTADFMLTQIIAKLFFKPNLSTTLSLKFVCKTSPFSLKLSQVLSISIQKNWQFRQFGDKDEAT